MENNKSKDNNSKDKKNVELDNIKFLDNHILDLNEEYNDIYSRMKKRRQELNYQSKEK